MNGSELPSQRRGRADPENLIRRENLDLVAVLPFELLRVEADRFERGGRRQMSAALTPSLLGISASTSTTGVAGVLGRADAVLPVPAWPG